MAGMDLFVSRSKVPSRPNTAISHPPCITLMPSSMKLIPRPSTMPTMTERGTSAAIVFAVPVSPSTSQISPVARLAAETVAAVIVAAERVNDFETPVITRLESNRV